MQIRPDDGGGEKKKSEHYDSSDNEKGWDRYAEYWAGDFGAEFPNLGDEWTAEVGDSDFVQMIEKEVFDRYLGERHTILEIGPGGGRITASLLKYGPKRLIACDVAGQMLDLIQQRFASDGRVETQKLTLGRGLAEVPKDIADAIVSLEVFVHIDPHDIWEYVNSFWDVMRPGAIGLIHHSDTSTRQGFERFLADHPYCINRQKPWSAFSVMSPEIFARMIEHRGFEPVAQVRSLGQSEERDCLSIFRKPEG